VRHSGEWLGCGAEVKPNHASKQALRRYSGVHTQERTGSSLYQADALSGNAGRRQMKRGKLERAASETGDGHHILVTTSAATNRWLHAHMTAAAGAA